MAENGGDIQEAARCRKIARSWGYKVLKQASCWSVRSQGWYGRPARSYKRSVGSSRQSRHRPDDPASGADNRRIVQTIRRVAQTIGPSYKQSGDRTSHPTDRSNDRRIVQTIGRSFKRLGRLSKGSSDRTDDLANRSNHPTDRSNNQPIVQTIRPIVQTIGRSYKQSADRSNHPADRSNHPADRSNHPADRSNHPADRSNHRPLFVQFPLSPESIPLTPEKFERLWALDFVSC